MWCALWRHLPILNIWRLKGLTAPLMFLFFVLYHLMLSGNFFCSEIRHGISFWHLTHSSSTLSFQGHSSTTPSQKNLPEKQIFWGTDPLGAPGCVYFLIIRWFILTDFSTMSLRINTYFGSNFSFVSCCFTYTIISHCQCQISKIEIKCNWFKLIEMPYFTRSSSPSIGNY